MRSINSGSHEPTDLANHDSSARVQALESALAQSAALLANAQDETIQWRSFFEAITDPVAVVNAEYHLVYANAAYRTMFHCVPDGVARHECFSQSPNPDGPCATCPTQASMRTRGPAFVQTERTTPEGRRVVQRWTYPVLTPGDTIQFVVEIIKDVTEQERLREQSRQTEALRAADRLKAELLGAVSHELRSPLTAIKGYAGTLKRHDGRLHRSERVEFLDAIMQASDRLESIIDQLLLMSQLETGIVAIEHLPIDIWRVAQESVAQAERTLEARGAGRYAFEVTDLRPRGAPTLVVSGDQRLLRQALDQVVDNAVKYSPEGGRIEVTLSERPVGGEDAPVALELSVCDNGVGIPEEHLTHIFDRFHRVDASLTQEFGGLGLGLSICRRIVELHGGAVWAESEHGRGSVFHMLLPAVPAPVNASPAMAAPR